MDIILVPLFKLADSLFGLLFFVIVSTVVLEWLFTWEVLSLQNQGFCRVYEFLRRFTNPIFDYVGRYVPLVGGFDLSPLIVILLISFVRNVLGMLLVKLLG